MQASYCSCTRYLYLSMHCIAWTVFYYFITIYWVVHHLFSLSILYPCKKDFLNEFSFHPVVSFMFYCVKKQWWRRCNPLIHTPLLTLKQANCVCTASLKLYYCSNTLNGNTRTRTHWMMCTYISERTIKNLMLLRLLHSFVRKILEHILTAAEWMTVDAQIKTDWERNI